MEIKTIQCYHCRQKLSVRTNEKNVQCPGCNLETWSQQTIHSSSSGNYHLSSKGCLLHCNLVKKIIGNRSSGQKYYYVSLNKDPSPMISPRPKKRAVLCGVTYNKGKFRLKGTINDVNNMRELLKNSFGFQEEGILVLTEEEKKPIHHPTRKNIEKALDWLAKDCERGDSLVFYFSGHGLRQMDFDGDEKDGFDETICPADFVKEGMILDNYINSTIVKPLKDGVTLHAIVDACHSGTVLDLEYVYNRDSKKWEDNRPPSGATKATKGGLAICLSACEDSQLSSDTTAFNGKTMNGVLTYVLTEIVNQYPGLTYGDLLDTIYERIKKVKESDCLLNSKLLKRFFKDRLAQKPQLSSSREFDVYRKTFMI